MGTAAVGARYSHHNTYLSINQAKCKLAVRPTVDCRLAWDRDFMLSWCARCEWSNRPIYLLTRKYVRRSHRRLRRLIGIRNNLTLTLKRQGNILLYTEHFVAPRVFFFGGGDIFVQDFPPWKMTETRCKAKPDCSPPGCTPRRLLIVVNLWGWVAR